MACEKCIHFSKNESGDDGFCKRFPPQLSAPNYSQFPAVKPEWKCGEYKPKKAR
jgi:hypothetical protein